MLSGLSKRIKSSISLRIAFLFFTTFALGLAFAFLVTYFELRYSLEKSSREILSVKLQETKAILHVEGIKGLEKFLSEEKNIAFNLTYMIRVLNSNGDTLYLKPSIQEKTFDFETYFQKKPPTTEILHRHSLPAIDDEDKFNIITEMIAPNLYLQIGKSSEDRDAILEEILLNFGIMEIVLVLLSALLGIWYAKKSLAPIRTLLATINSIENGNLSQRVLVTNSKDELQDLGTTFNRMISRIESLIRIMHESIDNVAHDIRTPLTRIRAVAEDALLSEKHTSLKEALEDCAESATNISEMVDQLLIISETEAGTISLQYEPCDLKVLLEDVLDIYEFVAQDKEIELAVQISPENLRWQLDRKKMKQVVANLLDNAIKFSPQKSKIILSAFIENEQLQLSIQDQGDGLPENEIQRIWNRLYRGDKSRSTKGSGLGLAIVRSVVVAHGGLYEAHNNPQKGMTFLVTLPFK